MLVTAYLDGVNLVCLCSVANGRGRVWRWWWWWVALTRYHVVRNWYCVIRWELNSSCASERGFVWAGPVVVFAVAIDGGLNGWGYSPAAVSTSPPTRSCFPVSLPPPPVHSSRCSRPLAWPSRWPWLSSGCPFDRALGVRSFGPKNRNRAIVAQFRGAPFKKAAGGGLGG